MAIFFDEQNKIFYLEGKNTTYAFGIHPCGCLQHLYYGKKVGRDDLHYIAAEGPSAFALRSPEDKKTSYQHIWAEAPAYGRGDFREPMYAIRDEKGDRLSELVYVRHEILPEKPMPAGLPALREGETLMVELADKVHPFTVRLYYTVYDDLDAMARRVEYINNGESAMFLDRAFSFSVDLPRSDFDVITPYGAWAKEFQLDRTPIRHGVTEIGSKYGATSATTNPFLILAADGADEHRGEVYGFNLIFSGSFAMKAELSMMGTVRVLGGAPDFDFSWKLEKGECFTAPEAVMVYSDEGLNGMSHQFHDTYRRHLINPRYVHAKRPVLINSWEGAYFNFDNERLMKMIDGVKGTGVDMFVLDDGWFGARNGDKAGLGDWVVNENKLKGGLKTVIDYTHAAGMKFGLWFEPEMVNPDSDLYRAHPDYAIHCPGHDPMLGRNQLVLDLTRADVRDYIVEAVSKVLRENEIDYVKWDFNRSVAENYSSHLPADRQMEFQYRFALGFFDLCERLVNGFPHIFFEGCSSGGARFDAGLMYYFPQIWTSDDTDAYMRTLIQYGASMIYPLSVHSCHVSACPNHQAKHTTPFATRADIAHLGATGYELDPAVISEEERAQITEQVAAYHEMEDLVLEGDLYRLSSTANSNFFAEELVSKDKTKALLTAMRAIPIVNDEIRTVYPKGLDENTVYHIRELNIDLHGSTIMNAGLKLRFPNGDYASAVWHMEKV